MYSYIYLFIYFPLRKQLLGKNKVCGWRSGEVYSLLIKPVSRGALTVESENLYHYHAKKVVDFFFSSIRINSYVLESPT